MTTVPDTYRFRKSVIELEVALWRWRHTDHWDIGLGVTDFEGDSSFVTFGDSPAADAPISVLRNLYNAIGDHLAHVESQETSNE